MKKIFFIGLAFLLSGALNAQEKEVILSPAVPFLMITPDARASGMGETGTATSADVWSMYWNPAKYAFAEGKGGAAFSYTPWMREVSSGKNLYSLAGYYRIDKKSVVAMTARYYTDGDFIYTNNSGDEIGETTPADFAIDATYARQFGEHFSMALAFRFIRSGVGETTFGDQKYDFSAATACAFDLGFFYTDKMEVAGKTGNWRVGLDLSNMGTKVSYWNQDNYLPANLRIGGGADLMVAENHSVALAVDFSKLLVEANEGMLKDNSVLANIGGSFGNEDFFKSVIWTLGAEYNYKKMVSGRVGYFHESEMYGNRQFVTLGVGGAYHGFALDASYLLATDSDAPYKNTFRLSLGYTF